MRNWSGGRKQLSEEKRKTIKIQVHVTSKEYEILNKEFLESGLRYFSDFIRQIILNQQTTKYYINKRELIKELDKIGAQIAKIAININQIAKYANIQLKTGRMDSRTIGKFNILMEQFLKEEKRLVSAYRSLIKGKE